MHVEKCGWNRMKNEAVVVVLYVKGYEIQGWIITLIIINKLAITTYNTKNPHQYTPFSFFK